MDKLTPVAGRVLSDDQALAIVQRFGSDIDQRVFRQDLQRRQQIPSQGEAKPKQTTAITGTDWLASLESIPSGYRAARSHGRAAYEIELPQATEALDAGRRQLPIIVEADTKRQIGVCVLHDDGKAIARFSRSAEGQSAEKRFGAGEDAFEVAYLQRGSAAPVPAALSMKTVSVGRKLGDTTMSDAQEMLAIGERHNRADLAHNAIRAGKSLADFRSELLEAISSDPIVSAYHPHRERSFSLTRLINAEVTGDYSEAGYEREVVQEARRAYPGQARGLVIPAEALLTRATMTTGGDAGGAVNSLHLGSEYIDVLRPVSSVIAAGARMLPGLNGNVSIPKASTDLAAAWVAEGAAITESDIDVDAITISPKMLAGRASFTKHLLATSSPDIDELVRRSLTSQIGVALDKAALEGSGIAPTPRGVANTPGVNAITTAAGGLTHADSLEALADIAGANLDTTGAVWIVNPTDAAIMGAKVKDSGSGRFVLEDGRIANRRVIETTQATAGTAYVGLWSEVMVGMWGGLDITVDPYTNGSTGVVNIYATQLADIAVRHPAAFTKVTLTA